MHRSKKDGGRPFFVGGLLVVVLLVVEWPVVKTRLKGLALTFVAAALVVAPMARYFLQHPDQFAFRDVGFYVSFREVGET